MKSKTLDHQLTIRYFLGELSEEEQTQLEEQYFDDDECFDQLLAFEEELIDDYVQGELPPHARERFETYFLTTAERREKVEFAKALQKVVSETEKEETPVPAKSAHSQIPWWQNVWDFLVQPRPAMQFGFVAALVLVLVWVSPLFRGSDHAYYRLASIQFEKEDLAFLTRNTSEQLLSEGMFAFDQGRYEQAIQKFDQFIATNADQAALSNAHYLTGVAHLNQATSDFLGRFLAVDAGRVESAIQNLNAAIPLTDNLHVKENVYWFLGKAYLLQQNGGEAKEVFKKVGDLNGTRLKDAQEILQKIEDLSATQP